MSFLNFIQGVLKKNTDFVCPKLLCLKCLQTTACIFIFSMNTLYIL